MYEQNISYNLAVNSMRHAAEELNLNSDVDFPKQSGLAMAMSPLGHKPGPFAQFTDATTVFNDSGIYAFSFLTLEYIYSSSSCLFMSVGA